MQPRKKRRRIIVMKREDLKAMGLTDEQIDKVMAANGTDIENAKKPYKDYDDIKGQLKTANDTITDLKKNAPDVEGLNKKIKDYETTINTMKVEAETKAKTAALVEALKGEKLIDPEYFIFKQGGIDKFTFGQDGKPVGVSDMVKPFKESNANWFEQEQQQVTGGFKPNQTNQEVPATKAAMQQQINQILGIKGEDK